MEKMDAKRELTTYMVWLGGYLSNDIPYSIIEKHIERILEKYDISFTGESSP